MMDLKKLNSILKDLSYPKGVKFVQQDDVHKVDYDNPVQGVEGEFFKIFEVVGEDGVFLKITYYTDSYGSGESIRGVEFVKPTEVVKRIFETI